MATELSVVWIYKVSSNLCRSILFGLCQKLIGGKSSVLPLETGCKFS